MGPKVYLLLACCRPKISPCCSLGEALNPSKDQFILWKGRWVNSFSVPTREGPSHRSLVDGPLWQEKLFPQF